MLLYKVYMIKDSDTDKRYIGKTRRELEVRFNEHINVAFKKESKMYNSKLSKAIRNGNVLAFKIGILANDIDEDEVDLVEQHYIDMYNTVENGLNTSRGGNDTSEGNRIDNNYDPEDNQTTEKKIDLDSVDDEEIDEFLKELPF